MSDPNLRFLQDFLISNRVCTKTLESSKTLWPGYCQTLSNEAFRKIIGDALHDLVPFVQIKKTFKHPWQSDTFSKVAGFSKSIKSIIPTLVFFIFLKLYKWYYITQYHRSSPTMETFEKCLSPSKLKDNSIKYKTSKKSTRTLFVSVKVIK